MEEDDGRGNRPERALVFLAPVDDRHEPTLKTDTLSTNLGVSFVMNQLSKHLSREWSSTPHIWRSERAHVSITCQSSHAAHHSYYPAVNWQDAQRRVWKSYREWLRSVSENRSWSMYKGLIFFKQGSRDTANVFAQHARVSDPNKAPTRI